MPKEATKHTKPPNMAKQNSSSVLWGLLYYIIYRLYISWFAGYVSTIGQNHTRNVGSTSGSRSTRMPQFTKRIVTAGASIKKNRHQAHKENCSIAWYCLILGDLKYADIICREKSPTFFVACQSVLTTFKRHGPVYFFASEGFIQMV